MGNTDKSKQAEIPPYLSLLGLLSDPFALENRKHFYLDQHLRDDLQLLTALIEKTTQLILVQGPQGAGKSSYCRQLSASLPFEHQLTSLRADAGTSSDLLLRKMAQGFGVSYKMGSQLTVRLFQAITDMVQANVKPVVMIDDAHCLDDKSLQLLADFNHEPSTPINLVLFGDQSLKERLAQLTTPIDFGGNANLIHLRPFSKKQTADFIDLHLQDASIQIPFILTDVQIAKLHKQAQGLPGLIKKFAGDMFRSKNVIDQIKALIKHEKRQNKKSRKFNFFGFGK